VSGGGCGGAETSGLDGTDIQRKISVAGKVCCTERGREREERYEKDGESMLFAS
jgi:hypothetical protein